jgi:ADP-ribosylglycohydrolase
MTTKHLSECIFSTIIGGAIGDALGVPVEFKDRGSFTMTGMTGHGTYNQPKGTWSDDTSLTLCLMENLIEGGDEAALMKKFSEYLRHGYWTPYGDCFDIGGTTARAIAQFEQGTPANQCGQKGSRDNGNGALMRIAPVVFLNINDEDFNSRTAKVEKYSALTHAHPRSVLGCVFYVELLRQLYIGRAMRPAFDMAVMLCTQNLRGTKYEAEFPNYERIFSGEILNLQEDAIKSGGYVVDTLEAALWCFMGNCTFKDTVLAAVNLGGDTDTTAIVAGSLAGMYCEAGDIPNEWINSLARIDAIKNLCQKYADYCATLM